MAESLVPRLDILRPEIKARWTARLRTEPAAPAATTALIHLEMLVFMLDDTLTRLSASLGVRAQARRPPNKSRQFRAPAPAARAGCTCCSPTTWLVPAVSILRCPWGSVARGGR